jgi:hypothetical protein
LVSEERGERRVKIDEKFFVSYRRTTIVSDEVLKGIWIPLTERNQFFRAYKQVLIIFMCPNFNLFQAQRREDDIAIVTGAFSAKMDPNNKSILKIQASFGGMAPTTKLALQTTKGLEGRKWNEELLDEVVERLTKEFELPPGVSFHIFVLIYFLGARRNGQVSLRSHAVVLFQVLCSCLRAVKGNFQITYCNLELTFRFRATLLTELNHASESRHCLNLVPHKSTRFAISKY